MEFRSVQEMQAVYEQRAEKGEDALPYILHYRSERQSLIFFGSRHSNDPGDAQWEQLASEWRTFLDHDNAQKVLLYELQPFKLITKDQKEAVENYNEFGFAVLLANENNISSESGEPGRIEEVEYLKEKGFSVPEIVTYYFGRQMHQWYRQDHIHMPDWQDYAKTTLKKYDSLKCWGDTALTLERAQDWFKETVGVDFNPNDEATLYTLSDPSQSVISAASGRFRDEHLFDVIQAKWQAGFDVFVVYDSGHAIRLELALEDLVKRGVKND